MYQVLVYYLSLILINNVIDPMIKIENNNYLKLL